MCTLWSHEVRTMKVRLQPENSLLNELKPQWQTSGGNKTQIPDMYKTKALHIFVPSLTTWSRWCEIMDDCEHARRQAGKLSLFTMWQVGMLWQAAMSRERKRPYLLDEMESLHTHISGVCEIFPTCIEANKRRQMGKSEEGPSADVIAGIGSGRQGSSKGSVAFGHANWSFFHWLLVP